MKSTRRRSKAEIAVAARSATIPRWVEGEAVFPGENKLRVVLVEVGKEPRIAAIGADLASMRAAIDGGYLRCVHLRGWPGVMLWCDDDGLSKRLPHNRDVPEIGDRICGTFFLSGAADAEGETTGIPDAAAAPLLERFALR